MAFEVHHNYFKAFEDVLDDIRQDGYWPTTFPPPGFSPDPWLSCRSRSARLAKTARVPGYRCYVEGLRVPAARGLKRLRRWSVASRATPVMRFSTVEGSGAVWIARLWSDLEFDVHDAQLPGLHQGA